MSTGPVDLAKIRDLRLAPPIQDVVDALSEDSSLDRGLALLLVLLVIGGVTATPPFPGVALIAPTTSNWRALVDQMMALVAEKQSDLAKLRSKPFANVPPSLRDIATKPDIFLRNPTLRAFEKSRSFDGAQFVYLSDGFLFEKLLQKHPSKAVKELCTLLDVTLKGGTFTDRAGNNERRQVSVLTVLTLEQAKRIVDGERVGGKKARDLIRNLILLPLPPSEPDVSREKIEGAAEPMRRLLDHVINDRCEAKRP